MEGASNMALNGRFPEQGPSIATDPDDMSIGAKAVAWLCYPRMGH
jgi:hypothetical protein